VRPDDAAVDESVGVAVPRARDSRGRREHVARLPARGRGLCRVSTRTRRVSHFHQKATRVAFPPNSDSGSARHDEVQFSRVPAPPVTLNAPQRTSAPPPTFTQARVLIDPLASETRRISVLGETDPHSAGFHHHCALVTYAHAFLTLERRDPKAPRPAWPDTAADAAAAATRPTLLGRPLPNLLPTRRPRPTHAPPPT
jgi:hypothetical protein